MKHLIFYKKNKPIIAIPMNGGLKISLVSVSCLPSHTLIRKIFKIYMYFKVLIAYIGFVQYSAVEGILRTWFYSLEISTDKLYPVFIWSLVEGRERYYVHLINEDGVKSYFVKITLKSEDYLLLENEKNKLQYFTNAKNFDVPSVISFVKNNSYCALITSYLDSSYTLYHPEDNIFPISLFKEISGNIQKVAISQLKILDKKEDNNNLWVFINRINKNNLVLVSNVHGDFGSENIFKNNKNMFYIIDWERSETIAPYLTDEIGYWLGKHHLLIKNNSDDIYKKFRYHFRKYNSIDIALGLLFLINVNFDLAILMSKSWKDK